MTDVVGASQSSALDPAEQRPKRSFTLKQFNRKIPAPSLLMHASDGFQYRCPWIEDSITIHSDGNVSCGLDDPNSQRSFGNILSQPIEDIFQNPEYTSLQSKLWNGHRCTQCSLYQRETTDFTDRINHRPRLPHTLIVEPTVKCNIRCLNSACTANNDAAIRTRDAELLPYDAFCEIVDQLKATLKLVYFFNYGDPFVHARAEDMLMYLRRSCPNAQIITSTNGIPLAKPERAARVVQSDLNCIVFTIGGIMQESYSRYHVNGRVDLALKGLENICAAKRELSKDRPWVVWRYLLFRWNDSQSEIEEALRLAAAYGVDDFFLYLTHEPFGAASFRFAPGTPNFQRYRNFIDCALRYTRHSGIPEPDQSGFYHLEDVEGLGLARWTTWRGKMKYDGGRRWIHLSLSTNRPAAQKKSNVAFVITPWKTYRIPLVYRAWQDLSLRIPPEYHTASSIELTIVTFDHWFPAEELNSPDLRCLGVLVKAVDQTVDSRRTVVRSRRTERFPGITADDSKLLADFSFTPPRSLPDNGAGRTWD